MEWEGGRERKRAGLQRVGGGRTGRRNQRGSTTSLMTSHKFLLDAGSSPVLGSSYTNGTGLTEEPFRFGDSGESGGAHQIHNTGIPNQGDCNAQPSLHPSAVSLNLRTSMQRVGSTNCSE